MQAEELEQHTHDHAHGHVHEHAHGYVMDAPKNAAFSLLRLSALQRMGLVLLGLVAIWGGVSWALS